MSSWNIGRVFFFIFQFLLLFNWNACIAHGSGLHKDNLLLVCHVLWSYSSMCPVVFPPSYLICIMSIKSGIHKYGKHAILSFSICFISFNIIISSYISVPINYPFYYVFIYWYGWKKHIRYIPWFLFILLINWHINWCHYLAIVNCIIENMDVQKPL